MSLPAVTAVVWLLFTVLPERKDSVLLLIVLTATAPSITNPPQELLTAMLPITAVLAEISLTSLPATKVLSSAEEATLLSMVLTATAPPKDTPPKIKLPATTPITEVSRLSRLMSLPAFSTEPVVIWLTVSLLSVLTATVPPAAKIPRLPLKAILPITASLSLSRVMLRPAVSCAFSTVVLTLLSMVLTATAPPTVPPVIVNWIAPAMAPITEVSEALRTISRPASMTAAAVVDPASMASVVFTIVLTTTEPPAAKNCAPAPPTATVPIID